MGDDSKKPMREQGSETGWRGKSIKGLFMSRPWLWATGVQSQWGPSDVQNTPQNCPMRGKEAGVYRHQLSSLVCCGLLMGWSCPCVPV